MKIHKPISRFTSDRITGPLPSLIAFGVWLVLSIGFLLLVSLVISAVITSLTQFMGNFLGGAEILAHVFQLLVSFIFVTALFAMIYKFLPDVRIRWRDEWIGAFFNFGALHCRKISDRSVLGSQRG